MMRELQPNDVSDFLARFQNFNDAVLHGFACKTKLKPSCDLTFEAIDTRSESGWGMVTIHLENVVSWKFAMSLNCAYYVMSSGVHLLYHDGLFYMDVSDFVDAPNNARDYLDSNFHFVASAIWWATTEIE